MKIIREGIVDGGFLWGSQKSPIVQDWGVLTCGHTQHATYGH